MGRWILVTLLGALAAASCVDGGDSQDATAGAGGEPTSGSANASGAHTSAAAPNAAGAGAGASAPDAGATSGGSPGSGGAGGAKVAEAGASGANGTATAGDGAGGADMSPPAFACIERGTVCDTLDDCQIDQFCESGTCVAGKPIGDLCTGEEYCGRDVRCVDGRCTYEYSLGLECGANPSDPNSVGPDPWLACPLGTYCGYWGPYSSTTGPTCGGFGTTDDWCSIERCQVGYFCRASGPGLPYSYPEYRCEARIPAGPKSCLMDAPDECQAGYVCNWLVGPEELDASPPQQTFGCVAPGKEGDYCDPFYPYDYYYPAASFPSQCGPNLYCSDEAAPDAEPIVWDPHGRCVPVAQPTTPTCDTDGDCATGEVCKDFIIGFKTCAKLPQDGQLCDPDVRYPCANGLECLFPTKVFFAPKLGYCTRGAAKGEVCNDDTLCADDGACVQQ